MAWYSSFWPFSSSKAMTDAVDDFRRERARTSSVQRSLAEAAQRLRDTRVAIHQRANGFQGEDSNGQEVRSPLPSS
jgi:hypothetical protein